MSSTPPSVEHTPDHGVFRAALRREKLAARVALDPAAHAALSAALERHLSALLRPLAPQTLAFCAPVRGEFDARPLASRLIGLGWHAAMPVVTAVDAPMHFHAWTPASVMGTDRYGIPIPADGAAVIPDIVLLPLLAFDAQGFRLGYGGGYFDRTLAAMAPRPQAIGVGFELGRVADIRPQAHDVRLDAIVTEAGLLRLA
ncbi:MAG: 5-formyltetrahydrofolate cyclo-ligase [Sulfuritalea sp.]|jgi:5-formyltetrahydrofolate cyclo-ligase|nr:5-formyltetrahydrofolate cyclo-ligase [Sulfuritalea sp.]